MDNLNYERCRDNKVTKGEATLEPKNLPNNCFLVLKYLLLVVQYKCIGYTIYEAESHYDGERKTQSLKLQQKLNIWSMKPMLCK